MKIAVLSGKGGTGKTFVSSNMAIASGKSVYIDCDVEEPNGRLFLKPQAVTSEKVYTTLPDFNSEKCTGCRKCVDFCKFNALVFIKKKPIVISEVCHACGGCSLVCQEDAVYEIKREVGTIEIGQRGECKVITGILNPGEASAIPVISRAISKGFEEEQLTIIDCPPGSSCSAMESVNHSDYCIMVVEPTSFGFHNFKMIHELVELLGKKYGVIINKEAETYQPLENYLKENGIPVLMRIPYTNKLAATGSRGELAVINDDKLRRDFVKVIERIGGEI